jgi:hypothetical protein
VRIETPGEAATGVFISPDGILLTNNHVLGVSVCPIEGCMAHITFLYQRDQPPPTPQTVFVVPLAVDVGLDLAAVRVFDEYGGSVLMTPSYVTLAKHDAAALVGTHVHVVGHPEGHLKKWTEGTVIDSSGAWVTSTAFILPGNSGSPMLDDAGHMVGIVHRAPVAQDMFSSASVDDYSIGSASAALIASLAAPLPPAIWSVTANTTDADVVANEYVYLTSQTWNATVGGASDPVLDSLGAACDAGLARTDIASPMDLTAALDPCTSAELWIECRSDGTPGGVCPTDRSAWEARFQAVFDHWKALNGQLTLDVISFGLASLSNSMSDGLATGLTKLQSELAAANAPLDFDVASYLAAFGATAYRGASLVDYFETYDTQPGYALSGTSIASGMLWLNDHGSVSGPDVRV